MNRQNAKTPNREPDKELDELARLVIGGAIEVHQALGPGYLESAYEEALAMELGERGIPFERQKSFQVRYKGCRVAEGRLDFLVAKRLVLEIKAVDRLAPLHKAQVISYLKAAGHHLGLLVKFNEVLLPDGLRRIILS